MSPCLNLGGSTAGNAAMHPSARPDKVEVIVTGLESNPGADLRPHTSPEQSSKDGVFSMTVLPSWVVRLSPVGGSLASLVGLAVLAGWGLQSTALTSIVPAWPRMSPLTALTFVVAGLALVLQAMQERARTLPDRSRAWLSRAARLCATAVMLVAARAATNMTAVAHRRAARDSHARDRSGSVRARSCIACNTSASPATTNVSAVSGDMRGHAGTMLVSAVLCRPHPAKTASPTREANEPPTGLRRTTQLGSTVILNTPSFELCSGEV